MAIGLNGGFINEPPNRDQGDNRRGSTTTQGFNLRLVGLQDTLASGHHLLYLSFFSRRIARVRNGVFQAPMLPAFFPCHLAIIGYCASSRQMTHTVISFICHRYL